MKHLLITAMLSAPATGWAQTCPAVEERTEEVDQIYNALRLASDPGTAQTLGGYLWQIWLDAPDETAQHMLDEGMAQRGASNFAGSRSALSDLIAYCPDYGEGYNQRAFTAFLARDYDAALDDLDRVLQIEPRHLGALTGKALTLMGMDRNAEAQEILRAALRLNPWLNERHLLEGPPETEL